MADETLVSHKKSITVSIARTDSQISHGNYINELMSRISSIMREIIVEQVESHSDTPKRLLFASSIVQIFSIDIDSQKLLKHRRAPYCKRREFINMCYEQLRRKGKEKPNSMFPQFMERLIREVEKDEEKEEKEEEKEEKSSDEKFIDMLVEYAEYETIVEKVNLLFEKVHSELYAEVETMTLFHVFCVSIGIEDRDRREGMSKKVVEFLTECGRKTARKFGISTLTEDGGWNKKLETQIFKKVLTEELMNRIGERLDVEIEIAENLIDSYNEVPKETRNKYSIGLVDHCQKVLEKRQIATDRKEIEKAKKKNEKNRKKKERQKMRKREKEKAASEDSEEVPEVFKRCMDAINKIL